MGANGAAADGATTVVTAPAAEVPTVGSQNGAAPADVGAASHPSIEAEIAVVGGGPTGALAALCAADAGWHTALVAPNAGHDPRTTALLMPAIELLEELGAWDHIEEHAAALATMRLVDDTGRLPRAPEISFDAHEIELDQFGFNIPNNVLNGALSRALEASGVVRVDAAADAVTPGAPVKIGADGVTVAAQFVVAADGSQSLVREEAGLKVRRWRYNQSAFVTTLGHERPHGDTSTEFHTPHGPFTLVPLPGDRSSLVWVGRPGDVERWSKMDPGPLSRAIEARSHNILGRVTADGPRGVIPMEGVVANCFGRGNIVLVGEAGHRFPPIGAQGLNLGMRDGAVLRDLLREAKQAGGLSGIAAAYHRKRLLDVNARTVGVDVLNRSLLTGAFPVPALRALGVAAARNIPPLRRTMMRVGLG